MEKKLTILLLILTLCFYLSNVFSEPVTFNVYQDKGPIFNVSGINVDCNGLYNKTNQTSPFTINFDNGIYQCTFSNINSNWEEKTILIDASNPYRNS